MNSVKPISANQLDFYFKAFIVYLYNEKIANYGFFSRNQII